LRRSLGTFPCASLFAGGWFQNFAVEFLQLLEFLNPLVGRETAQGRNLDEAKDATWSIVRPTQLDAYTALVRRSYHFGLEDQLVRVNATDWPDQGNRVPLPGPPAVELAGLVKASEDCRGVRFPPIVNGRLMERSTWKDPCEELGTNRLELSNGTVCYDWPTVMLDDTDGREIVAESEHPELLLRKIIEQRRKVILIGQRDLKRCSPVLLWAVRAQ